MPERNRREAGVAGAARCKAIDLVGKEELEPEGKLTERLRLLRIAGEIHSSNKATPLRIRQGNEVPHNTEPSAFQLLASEEMLQWQEELREAVLCRPHLLDPVPWPCLEATLSPGSLQCLRPCRRQTEVSVWEKEALFCMASEATVGPCPEGPPQQCVQCRCSRAFKGGSARSRWIWAWSRWRRRWRTQRPNSPTPKIFEPWVLVPGRLLRNLRGCRFPPCCISSINRGPETFCEELLRPTHIIVQARLLRLAALVHAALLRKMLEDRKKGKHTPLRPLLACSGVLQHLLE